MKRRLADRVGGGLPDAQDAADVRALAAVGAVLERKPEVVIPADFARRAALRAGTLPQSRKGSAVAYARVIALVVSVLVAGVLFVLAPRTAADFHNVGFDLEMLILGQLGLLAWWFSGQTRRSLH